MKKWPFKFLFLFFICIFSCQKESFFSKTDQLFAFSKLYGYIKYFHPSDEAALIDWDKFALLGSQYILENDNRDTKTILEDLFLPIAPSIQLRYPDDPIKEPSLSQISGLMPICWQHRGNGRGGVRAVYASARVNRPAKVYPDSPNDYSSIRQNLDVTDLKGKTVRVSADIKSGLFYNGLPFLELRYNKKGKERETLSSRGQALSAGEWKQHQIEGHLPQNMEKVNLYLLNIGMAGSVAIDNISLQVKKGETWETYPLSNADFEKTTDWEKDWQPWGPNQDFELLTENGNQFLKISRTKGKWQSIEPLYEQKTNKLDVFTKDIGCNIQCQFSRVVYGDSIATYPKAEKETYRQLIEKIEGIPDSDLKVENLYARLGNVVLMWNHLQHFFPYFEQAKVDWKQQFYEAVEKSFVDKTEANHKNTLKRMLSPLNDSHIGIYSGSTKEYFPPIRWEWIENQVVITHVLDSTLAISAGNVVGRINNQIAADYWADILKITSGATTARKNFKAIKASLVGEEGTAFTIEISTKNGKNTEITLKRNIEEVVFDKQTTPPELPFKEYSDGIYYVNLNQINWSDLQSRIPLLAKAKGIVFDLRGYPRWQTINIVSHFISDSIATVQLFTPLVSYPDQEKIRWEARKRSAFQPKSPFIAAQKVFITNGSAVSYAETFLNLIEFYQLAQIVGEQTAGTTGHTDVTHLLGGITCPWTGMKVLRQDGSLFHTRGILPTHPVKKTINGVAEGKDEFLEKALSLLSD